MSEVVSTYTGKSIEITYDRRRCIHAAECGRAKSELFSVKNDPWCDPNAVSAEEAVEIVRRCPTGALTFRRLDGGAGEEATTPNTIHVIPDGPLYARGRFKLIAADGVERSAELRVALCRCGQSAHKPYCDGAHAKTRFRDAGPVNGSPTAAAAEATGEVEIREARNGPLVLAGAVALYAGSGRLAKTDDQMALCRCGGSENKPFCDGSHARIAFQSEAESTGSC